MTVASVFKKGFSAVWILTFASLSALAQEEGYNGRFGWPVQQTPQKIIKCTPGTSRAETMLIESLSGLAAQAVNDGKSDEMVWIDVPLEAYRHLYQQTVASLQPASVETMEPWALVRHLKKQGIVKGYILYKLDKPRKELYSSYPDLDYSVNVATVYAALLGGVLIDEALEPIARKAGLRKLKDARTEDPAECFRKNKTQLSNQSALSIPPGVSNLRDYAIAHKLMLYADEKELIDSILEWVTPLSPILGWGCGDEYDFTSVISEWGHFNTASNWCWNLPLISAVGGRVELLKAHNPVPERLEPDSAAAYHSFVMSDGDNMQWTMGDFQYSDRFYGNIHSKELTLSWTLCPINLSVVSPHSWNRIAAEQPSRASLIEYGGGYQYPDLFAIKRPNRAALLRDFARRINYHITRLNIQVVGFLCREVASEEAQEAFQIYAEELDSIAGILAVQYFPYELAGEVYWMKNAKGIRIPVVTARYSLWDEVNPHRPRAGTPEYIASLINRDVLSAQQPGQPQRPPLSWTIVHAWSNFTNSSTLVPQPAIGTNPVKATEQLLLKNIQPVSVNELLWRLRYQNQPDQTRQLLKR